MNKEIISEIATELNVKSNQVESVLKLLDENKIPYEWTIYTNDTDAIKNPHIIYKKPSLNIIELGNIHK